MLPYARTGCRDSLAPRPNFGNGSREGGEEVYPGQGWLDGVSPHLMHFLNTEAEFGELFRAKEAKEAKLLKAAGGSTESRPPSPRVSPPIRSTESCPTFIWW